MSEDDLTEKERVRWEAYYRHRDNLIHGEFEQARSYDKHILALASGALGLSVIFVNKIAPRPACWSYGFLVGAWTCLTLSILSTLCSFLSSQAAYRRSCEDWDKHMDSEKSDEGTLLGNPYATCTTALNILSMALFVLGVSGLVVFAAGNIDLAHQ